MIKPQNCTFCKYAQHKEEAPIIFENKYILAFLDELPAGPIIGHALVIPKKHYTSIESVDDKTLCEIMKAIKLLVPAITKTAGAQGTNIIQNNGKAAGQNLAHIHFHIIPRKMGDGIWFDTKRRAPKPMERFETAKAIQELLKK